VIRRTVMKRYSYAKLNGKGWSDFVMSRVGRSISIMAAVVLAGVLLVAVAPVTQAADAGFPKKPINFYLPYPPGGSLDVLFRPIADVVGKILGQPLVTINKPGASGVLMATMLKTMPPDGYDIGIVGTSLFILPAQQDVNYDTLKDFTFIAKLVGSEIGIVVRKDSPWKTFKEFVQYAKANPGKIKYGTSNPRGSLGISMIDTGMREGIKWDMVPFSGGQEVVTALLGKHIDAMVEGPSEYMPLVDSGDFRLIALIGDQPSKLFPDVPTFKQLGYPPYAMVLGLIGPAGMTKDVTAKLCDAFEKALSDPNIQKNLAQWKAPVIFEDSAGYTAWAKWASAHYAEMVKKAGMSKK
jgi:tripartite-type tricarboxylate transporter receptor subunit TctC